EEASRIGAGELPLVEVLEGDVGLRGEAAAYERRLAGLPRPRQRDDREALGEGAQRVFRGAGDVHESRVDRPWRFVNWILNQPDRAYPCPWSTPFQPEIPRWALADARAGRREAVDDRVLLGRGSIRRPWQWADAVHSARR